MHTAPQRSCYLCCCEWLRTILTHLRLLKTCYLPFASPCCAFTGTRLVGAHTPCADRGVRQGDGRQQSPDLD